eukprot:SAG25_NODE_6863_length_523_cov_1.007075_2_plen_21_part_01
MLPGTGRRAAKRSAPVLKICT